MTNVTVDRQRSPEGAAATSTEGVATEGVAPTQSGSRDAPMTRSATGWRGKQAGLDMGLVRVAERLLRRAGVGGVHGGR